MRQGDPAFRKRPLVRVALRLLGLLAYTAAVLTISGVVIMGNILGDCFDNAGCRSHQRAFAQALPYAICIGLFLNNLVVLWIFGIRRGEPA